MSNILLKASDLKKTYKEGKVLTEVLKGVNLEIYENELTAIVGQSGSGKSTLLHILGTLSDATSGSLFFRDLDLLKINSNQRAAFRNNHLGFVYQFHHLLGDFTSLENVMLPLLIQGKDKSFAKNEALEILDRVGLSHRINFKPSEISGGERQRVAIARALVHKPDLVLADEPTGNLDEANSKAIFKLFKDLTEQMQTAVVMVTHDLTLANSCNRVYHIKSGLIEA